MVEREQIRHGPGIPVALGIGAFGQFLEEGRVAIAKGVGVPTLLHALGGILPDDRQELEALAIAAHQASIDEGAQDVQLRAADVLGGVEAERPGEHAQAGEQLALGIGQEIVAPIERGAQGSVPFGLVACSTDEQLRAGR